MVVSHDRHFISQIANKIWYIEDGQVKEYPGTYEEYAYRQSKRETATRQAPEKKSKGLKPKAIKQPKGLKKTDNQVQENELKKLKKELKAIEEKIEQLEAEKRKLETEMADTAIFSDFNKLQQKQQAHESITQSLEKAQTRWEKLAGKIIE